LPLQEIRNTNEVGAETTQSAVGHAVAIDRIEVGHGRIDVHAVVNHTVVDAWKTPANQAVVDGIKTIEEWDKPWSWACGIHGLLFRGPFEGNVAWIASSVRGIDNYRRYWPGNWTLSGDRDVRRFGFDFLGWSPSR
jgi:hypothetical protein